jgi:hypothetical protein
MDWDAHELGGIGCGGGHRDASVEEGEMVLDIRMF